MKHSACIPYGFARQHGVLAIEESGQLPTLFMRVGADPAALAEIRRRLGRIGRVETLMPAQFESHLSSVYTNQSDNAAEVVADLGQDLDLSQLISELPTVEDLLESQDDAPIIRMINALLTQAVRQAASDVHIEPYEQYSAVRFRRDGLLVDVAKPHRALHAAMASRIKIMANLDIAERRMPQDGRIALRVAGRQVDVRVSSLPTTHGERIVLRLLDKESGCRDLNGLGMSFETISAFSALLRQTHGIVLVTGPTGSGKSTSLYAALQAMEASTRNIVTVEDPVEYDLPGVAQVQINARIDLDFARALRAILRQDPDVIMIGEIRDLETARIAVQASLTGHLVLATLHTNDAASAVTRLIDMGIEPFLLASTLRGVLAQRLVRRLCVHCRQPSASGLPGWSSPGCPACSAMGYAGRTGIYELLVMDESMCSLVHNGAEEAELRARAHAAGMRSLYEDGMRLALEGITSMAEVLRVTHD